MKVESIKTQSLILCGSCEAENQTSHRRRHTSDRFPCAPLRKPSAIHVLGTPWAFVWAIVIIVVWALTGPAFHYSDTWQLIINTGTTIVTFLMVFLIRKTQNRDAKAMHLKLAELIRALGPARNKLVDLEKLSDDELQTIE